MKKYLLLLAVAVTSMATFASVGDTIKDDTGELKYVITSLSPNTVKVGYNPMTTGELTLPASITSYGQTYSVTAIGENAFFNCRNLTKVTLPATITEIEPQGFAFCSGITTIKMSPAITAIGKGAFYNCSALTSIEIPPAVASIGEAAFLYCMALQEINMPASVTTVGKMAFSFCNGLETVHISESLAVIPTAMLAYCGQIKKVNIPASVTRIDTMAFYGCAGLARITSDIADPATVEMPDTNTFAYVPKGSDPNACLLYVPQGSRNKYLNIPKWQDFAPYIMDGEYTDICTPATQQTLTLYPNPATDRLTITLDPNDKTGTVAIIDLSGRTVLTADRAGTETTIDISRLPAATYIVRVGDKTMKFIKPQ